MRTLLCWGAAGAALLVAGAAHATDIFAAAPAYPTAFSPVPLYNWTGLYVGVNGGAGFGNPTWASGPDSLWGSYSTSSGLVGGTFGYNFQTHLGRLVLGQEIDLDAARFHATITPPYCVQGCEFRSTWVGSARLRLGYAFEQFMPYVTAGLSGANLTTDIPGLPFGTQSKINLSYAVGAGLEVVLADRWSAKLEYLYMDHGGITCAPACGSTANRSPGFNNYAGPVSFNFTENVVRVGVNYRLWDK
jgi:outer membrane immunogenic protein